MPSTCFGLRAPTIAPVTAGWRNVQAMAISPGVGQAYPAHLAFLLQGYKGGPTFERLVQVVRRPMDLV
jgi:hypothetical protein